jgi:hypothetical protein
MFPNSETEKLGFAYAETVRGAWGNLFKPEVSAAQGYSIEVFRGRSHIGSIAVTNTTGANQFQQQLRSRKVQNGDILIWVSLMPRQVDMNVPLTTIDGNYPVCRLTLMLRVDPARATDFANLFYQSTSQNNDPVVMAKAPITSALQRYARQRTYEQLDDDDMRHRALQSLYGQNKQYGLIVDSVSYLSVPPDEHIARRIQIGQEARTQRVQIEETANNNALQDQLDQERTMQQNAFRRSQSSLDNAHQRSEQELDNTHRRRQELHEGLHQTIQQGLINRLQRNLNAGKSLYHIQDENPDIANIADISNMYNLPPGEQATGALSWQERAQLAPGNASNMRALESNATPGSDMIEEDDEAIPGLSRHHYTVFSLREPGITVLRVQPSTAQRQLTGMQALTAMLVCEVHTDEAAFAIGDLIITVADIAATDIEVLTLILKERHPAVLPARILRGETVLEVTIQSMA